MKRVVELPQEYDAMREVLEREEKEEDIDRNAWKRSEWRDGEDLGAFCNAPMPAPLGPARGPSLPSDMHMASARLGLQCKALASGQDYAASACTSEDDELHCVS